MFLAQKFLNKFTKFAKEAIGFYSLLFVLTLPVVALYYVWERDYAFAAVLAIASYLFIKLNQSNSQ